MSSVSEIYQELEAAGYEFKYVKRTDRLQVSKDGQKLDVMSVAVAKGTTEAALLQHYKELKENAKDTHTTALAMPPRRECLLSDVEVYGGNFKAIISDNSISYAIRDCKTGCYMVKSKNSDMIPSFLQLDEEYIKTLIGELNAKLNRKISVSIDALPRQLFLYDKAHNSGGVQVTRSSSGKLLHVDADIDLSAFYNNKTVDQKIFTPKNPYASQVLFDKNPTVFTNDPDDPAISFFDKKAFIAECEQEFSEGVPDTPHCDSWLSKYSETNREIIKDFIWSIFDTEAETSECLWLYDEGNLGKTTLYKFISALMERYIKSAFGKKMAYSSKSLDVEIKSQFYTSKIYDKRLVCYADCKNTKIIKTELIHRMTGGDPIEVEGKYEKSFQFLMSARIMVFSNAYPSIDVQQKNELRRVLLITSEDPFAEVAKVIKRFERELIKEAQPFLYKCYLSYLGRAERNDGKTDLIQSLDKKRLAFAELDLETADTELVKEGCITYTELFDITRNPKDRLSYEDMEKVLSRTAQGFEEIATGRRLKWHYDKRAIKQFLMKEHHLEASPRKVGERTVRMFIGVKFAFQELDEILHPDTTSRVKEDDF